MFILKLLLWLSSFIIFYLLFSSNTLISIFCFIIIIFFAAILLLQLHIEYVTYLIILLYLGGILIFFLFTALMLNNEYHSLKNYSQYSFENILLFLVMTKSYLYITAINYNLCLIKIDLTTSYLPTIINNKYYFKDIINNQGDMISFISLYTEKYLLLFLLGNILLFTMMGVIVITKK